MKYIIVTEPNTRAELQYAFDLLDKQGMRPVFVSCKVLYPKNERLHDKVVVIRPMGKKEKFEGHEYDHRGVIVELDPKDIMPPIEN